jgi:hypothetical protein
MSNNQHATRREKKVAAATRAFSRDIERGMAWAGAELARAGAIAGRDVKQGGKRIGAATRQRMTLAGNRLKSHRLARTTKA